MAKTPWIERVFAKLLTWQGLPPDGATALDQIFREERLKRSPTEPARPRDDGSTYWVYTTDFDEVAHYEQLWPGDDAGGQATAPISEPGSTDVAVTLLIENSGSMRQQALPLAAICIRSLIDQLQNTTPRLEVLGFTTVQWKGGRARGKWKLAGSPLHPGRLNELLHIIYRSHDDPVGVDLAGRVIATLARADISKENIDGEAVSWAVDRLLLRPEPRKLLILLGDGPPIDDSTNYYNGQAFLRDHLRDVIRSVEEKGAIRLARITLSNEQAAAERDKLVIASDEGVREKVAAFLAALLPPETA